MSLFLQDCNASIKNKYGSCEFDLSRIFLVTKHQCVVKDAWYSRGNPGKDRQQFVCAFVSISASDWSNRLSNFENVIET